MIDHMDDRHLFPGAQMFPDGSRQWSLERARGNDFILDRSNRPWLHFEFPLIAVAARPLRRWTLQDESWQRASGDSYDGRPRRAGGNQTRGTASVGSSLTAAWVTTVGRKR